MRYGERSGPADTRRHRRPLGSPVGRRWHLPIRYVGGSSRRVFDRHPAADSQRLTAHGARVQLHPHRHDRPLPAHARQAGLLPDGLGRQRSADRATRPELLRRALRSARALRAALRRHRSEAIRPRNIRPSRSLGPTFSNSATNSSRWTKRSSRRSIGDSG